MEQARAAARRWVAAHAATAPGFEGAFLNGSTAWLPPAAALPVGSDVDVTVVVRGERAPRGPGKIPYDGVLVEVSHTTWDELPDAETVLATHYLAGAFRAPGTVLADPTGRLARLHTAVARDFARRPWVMRRCSGAERRIVDGLDRLDGLPAGTAITAEEAIAWVFPAGVTTHVLLTAGLRNPTVRRRYADVRELLAEHGRQDLHEELLRLLGCAEMTRDRVEHHLAAMTAVLDRTGPAADRPAAVDGGRDLVARGLHREAVFWIVVTMARRGTGPELTALLADLGIVSPADLRSRGRAVRELLPRLRETARDLVAANPLIRD